MNVSVFNGDSLRVGGYTFSNPKNLKILFHYMGGGGTKYSTGRLGSGSAGYVVPTGFKLVIRAVKAEYNGSTVTNLSFTFGYGDTDVGLNSGSLPTSPVYFCGDSNMITGILGGNIASEVMNGAPINFEVPAGKYFFMGAGVGTCLSAFGELVAV